MSDPVASEDPRPEPPREPSRDDCCGGGCNPCVFDLYSEAYDKYRRALEQWEARHHQ